MLLTAGKEKKLQMFAPSQAKYGVRLNSILPLINLVVFPTAPNAQNAVISPNFLVWKFCGEAQSLHSFGQNCAFPQKLHTRKLGEITAFYAVSIY